jgi:general secretion pathway protein D
MKKACVFLLFMVTNAWVPALVSGDLNTPTYKENSHPTPGRKQQNGKKIVKLNYINEDLVNVINAIAAEKGVNILLPHGQNAITSKVTVSLKERLTVSEAWDILFTLLDVAGYSLIEKDGVYTIVKNSPTVDKEVMPIFINTPWQELPNSDERIRFLGYLSNIKVADMSQGGDGGDLVSALVKDVMPEGTIYKTDPQTNSILLVDKSDNIRSLMKIITELDKEGFKEALDIMQLRYTSASIVADFFNKNILRAGGGEQFPLGLRKAADGTYFSKAVKIIPDDRSNSLILLGKRQAIDRVKEAILNHIDVELDSGESVLHTYQLQYLDARSLAEVLNRIVQSGSQGTIDQSKVVQVSAAGPERSFEGVIIKADTPEGQGEGKYFGGNKLVVAARKDDWLRIRGLIEELDSPQPQVIIEVLIVDLSNEDINLISSQIRNPNDITGRPFGPNAQSAQMSPTGIIYTGPGTNPPTSPSTIADDLLRIGGDPQFPTQSLAGLLAPGSTVISFTQPNTNSIFAILQLLKNSTNSKILSHPHFMGLNNQPASIEINETRLVAGDGAGSGAGAVTANNVYIPASLKVNITPRISSADTVNLQVGITIQDFLLPNSNSDATRTNRNLVTNANVKSGGVLALGGLIRVNNLQSQTETPVLGKIPIIGWFFKAKNSDVTRQNLTVLIAPIIVQPRLRSGVGEYTKDYLQVAKKYVKEGMLFDTLRDPITRWYFKSDTYSKEVMDLFVDQGGNTDFNEYGTDILSATTTGEAPLKKEGNELTFDAQGKPQSRFAKLSELAENNGNPLLNV